MSHFKLHNYLNLISEAMMVDGISVDEYGARFGIENKSAGATLSDLNQPESGPIGSIEKSALANVNVPTRSIPRTDNGNLGCAAAVSIIFYRATGYHIADKNGLELSTANLWDHLSSSNNWDQINQWESQWQPGDIILTRRGSRPGHVGVVVEGGKIVSNSSGGFEGDNKGQIEVNYSISSWKSVASRNPNKTACFRYKGPYLERWGDSTSQIRRNNASDSDVIAKYGSKGQAVASMQMALISSGYDLPKYGVDGKFYSETRSALKKFQKDQGLDQTGVYDKETAEILSTAKETSPNSTGKIKLTGKTFGKRFKIFDKESRNVVIAKIQKDGSINILNRIGSKLGDAKLEGGKIQVNYNGKSYEAKADSDNQVVRSIYRIFNRISGASIGSSSQGVQSTSTPSGGKKMTPQEFIKTYSGPIIDATKGTPLLPSVKMAQAALETGWGKHVIGDANNMFGIKASGSPNEYWDGSKVNANTAEYYNGVGGRYNLDFRKYKSLQDSIKDHSRLLMTLPRYSPVRSASTAEDQARALQSSGYATSPTYANKLISIINKWNLKTLDQGAGQNIA
jgi:flagellum-specific peptidoglycan hydrolase FlgJ